jgi:hypothetical protein
MQKEYKLTLNDPISVAKDGKNIEGRLVVIKSPRRKDAARCLKVEAIFKKCFLQMASQNFANNTNTDNTVQDNNLDDEQSKIDSILLGLMMGSEDDTFDKLIYHLQELLCAGNQENPQATIEGVKFTRPIFDELSVEDLKKIIGGYIASFLYSTFA